MSCNTFNVLIYLIFNLDYHLHMNQTKEAIYRKILRKSEGLGFVLCRTGIDPEALLSHGWTEVSDGEKTLLVELKENGKLEYYFCVKHLFSKKV